MPAAFYYDFFLIIMKHVQAKLHDSAVTARAGRTCVSALFKL